MKTKALFALAILLAGLLAMPACEKKKEDTTKELTPEEAKIELRDASQEISTNMDNMMSTPAMQSVDFLMQMMGSGDVNSTLKTIIFNSGRLNLTKVKQAFAPTAQRDDGIGQYGIYAYNFIIDEFELVETTTNSLVLRYPANETAYNGQQNNAELAANNLVYTTITYEDTYWDDYSQTWVTDTYEDYVPTNLAMTLKIDNQTAAQGNYSSTLTESGIPTSVTVGLSVSPYQFQATLSGGGASYLANLSFKKDDVELMAINWNLIYTADMENVQTVNGYYMAMPLRIEGSANFAAIDSHMNEVDENGGTYDLTFLNNQLNMQLIHVVLNAKIGDIQFKMYTDPDYGDTYPELAVVYGDGTFEWLSDIMGENGYKFARSK